MKKSHPQKINHIISCSHPLKQLIKRSQQQLKILNTMKQLLPKQLAEHCISAHHIDQSLKVFTDSSVWASKLRFQSKSLCHQLSNLDIITKNIDVRVSPESQKLMIKKKKRPHRRLSMQTAETLRLTAESIDDKKLKKALKRLAQNTH